MATGPLTIDAALRSTGVGPAHTVVRGGFSRRAPAWRVLIRSGLSVTAAFTCGLVLSEPSMVEDRRHPDGAPAATASSVPSRAPVSAPQCSERVYDRLFFGLGTPDGVVSEGAWAGFLREVVTPRFPEGLTVVEAHGQWRGDGDRAVIVERSRVVEVAHPDSPEIDRQIDEVVAIFKQRHRQRSVMRTRARVEVCL